MSVNDCRKLVQDYIQWLSEKISVKDFDGICEITTPFLDRHNDHLQIYVKKIQNHLVLTDDGYTLRDLQLSGCEFNTDKRSRMLKSVLNGFGITRDKNELVIHASPTNFPQKKHNLLQAIMAINDLFVLAAPTVASFFKEDVERFLCSHDIRYTPDVKFHGKSGFDHHYDFVIPASNKMPERLISVINKPERQNITSTIFAWDDIGKTRPEQSSAYSVINDSERNISQDWITALSEYEIKPILWSNRKAYVEELAA